MFIIKDSSAIINIDEFFTIERQDDAIVLSSPIAGERLQFKSKQNARQAMEVLSDAVMAGTNVRIIETDEDNILHLFYSSRAL